uniref:YqaJ viral recombinase domain-containing protein n=1 Tax=Cacopsylla melanoneura TaxID=428564 RepID=A0A8D8SYM1_9HEMI
MSAVCVGCEAAAGGCKHILAFLYWLYRRSMEPASTSTTCYWAKPTLSKIGSTIKYIKLENLTEKVADPPSSIDPDNCLADFINQANTEKTVCQISPYLSDASASPASLHLQMFNFKLQENEEDAEKFILFLQSQIKSEDCHLLLKETVDQSRNKKWHELRYGRITASKIFEALHCKTMDGSLVESILGARKLKDNKFLKRGRELEDSVLLEVGKKLNIPNIQKCGLFINPEWPVLGASPDGLTEKHVFEVKCPSSEKTKINYIKDGNITYKCLFQMLLQMKFAGKKEGIFCVADPDFEQSRNVTTIHVPYDAGLCDQVLKDAVEFWKKAIFPHLYRSA